jgi:pimeloyl-ACP methyl ester carboxylesterase
MLIHGAWLSARSWENFAHYFDKRGFAVSAPEWPRKEGDVEELRAEADELKGLGLTEIVDHYEAQIRALDEPPVLVGHSFGGLIVELLLDRGLGRAGVALSPAPPKGILVKDHTVPASLSRKQYEKYERSPAETEFIEFEGRPHLLMAAEGWEEVAAAIDSWLDGLLEAPRTPARGASA